VIFKSIFYIIKFHNSSHELGMIHKFNNTQRNKISFKYPIHESNGWGHGTGRVATSGLAGEWREEREDAWGT
jgi:hypothetical protein